MVLARTRAVGMATFERCPSSTSFPHALFLNLTFQQLFYNEEAIKAHSLSLAFSIEAASQRRTYTTPQNSTLSPSLRQNHGILPLHDMRVRVLRRYVCCPLAWLRF